MLDVADLTCAYVSQVPVVHGVTMTVPDGGAVGVVGRNGAGKTCLAETIAGVRAAVSGSVQFSGKDLPTHRSGTRPRVRAGLSLVPEGRRIFAQLTVRENLAAAAYGVGRTLEPAMLDEIVAVFPVLGRKVDDRAGGMSGGEQQWLAIARALIQKPRLIVLDEPSLGLAPVAVASLGNSLAAVRDSGVGLLLMEQNPRLLRRVCEVVHVMDRGVVTQTRPTSTIANDGELIEVVMGR